MVAVCARSLWATLAAAVSTLALFGAANWGVADFFEEQSFIKRFLLHTMWAFAMPLTPLQLSLRNALSVWSMKHMYRIHKTKVRGGRVQQVDSPSIAIFSICPLVIQAPLSTDLSSSHSRGYLIIGAGAVKDLCPLELSPREATIADPHAAASAMNTDHQQPDSAAHGNAKRYLQLCSSTFMTFKLLKEKELLLTLGLVPEYSELRFLRSRSRFQSLITGLQAGGYVLSVVQRLAQHLAVSPLEALLCYLSVIIIVQLLLELYACSHYQRPLLLRLNHLQFSQFWDAPRPDTDTESSSYRIPYVADSVLLVMLFSALSIYYSVHYMHSCLICSVAALLFLVALLSWVIFFIPFVKSDFPSALLILPLSLSILIFLSSMVLAVVSTATHWDLFDSPTHNSFSWILPHVSS